MNDGYVATTSLRGISFGTAATHSPNDGIRNLDKRLFDGSNRYGRGGYLPVGGLTPR